MLCYNYYMSSQPTNEFSICLLANSETTADIESMRRELPTSPHRDDPPHITLLRGVTSSAFVSDAAIAKSMGALLTMQPDSIGGNVKGVEDKSNHLYSSTTALTLTLSDVILNYRKALINNLKANNYKVESQELATFIPHLTIRLGVALDETERKRAEAHFLGKQIKFTRYALFRLVQHNGSRQMHIVEM